MDLKENWVVWSIVTLSASLIIAYATLSAKNGTNRAEPAQSASAPRDPVSLYEPSIKAAVRNADQAQIMAHRTLDPRYLHNSFTGEGLQQQLNELKNLESQGLRAFSDLVEIGFGTVLVEPDTVHAKVEMTETWSSVFYNSNDVCVGRTVNVVQPQTVFLERRADRWLISALDHRSQAPPALQPCVD